MNHLCITNNSRMIFAVLKQPFLSTFASLVLAAKGYTSSMNPQRRDVLVFLIQKQNDQLLQLHQMLARRRRRRERQIRNAWERDWITRRPEQGLYDRLMVQAIFCARSGYDSDARCSRAISESEVIHV